MNVFNHKIKIGLHTVWFLYRAQLVFMQFTLPSVSLGTWISKITFVLQSFIPQRWTSGHGSRYKRCDFNNSAAFPPVYIQETQIFSFSFQFHVLDRVSSPSVPSWKADSTVHCNPWNSRTCFSNLLLTCNISSSGI